MAQMSWRNQCCFQVLHGPCLAFKSPPSLLIKSLKRHLFSIIITMVIHFVSKQATISKYLYVGPCLNTLAVNSAMQENRLPFMKIKRIFMITDGTLFYLQIVNRVFGNCNLQNQYDLLAQVIIIIIIHISTLCPG